MTLIELLFVMLILGITASIAFPALSSSGRELRLENAAHQLAMDLFRARSEAISRNQSVSLARTGDSSYSIEFTGNRNIDGDIVLSATAGNTLRFTSVGSLTTAGRGFTLTLAGDTRQVLVSTVGLARVQ